MNKVRTFPMCALVLVGCLLARMGSAACPACRYYCSSSGQGDTVSAQFTISCWNAYQLQGRGTWDLIAGTFSASNDGGELSPSAGFDLYDDYLLSGTPEGVPVDFVAHLTGGRSHSASASEEVGGEYASSTFGLFALNVHLHKLPGQTFRLHMLGGGAGVSARLTFSGTSGGRITSCYGFAANVSTPVNPATWGALRRAYR